MCVRDWGSTVFNFCCSVVKISSGYNYNAAEWFVFYIFIQYTCIFSISLRGICFLYSYRSLAADYFPYFDGNLFSSFKPRYNYLPIIFINII